MYKLNFKNNTSRYTEKELLDNIQIVWDFKGSQPFCKDMCVYPSNICFTTYFNRFGSWKKALEHFVKYKNNGKIDYEAKIYNTNKRKNINNSLRFEIMKRDFFKCCICGNSPALDNNVCLEIDHIIPVSKGGKNDFDNLRTICKNCNIGKFNK